MFSPEDKVYRNILSQPAERLSCYSYNILPDMPVPNRTIEPFVEIVEQPISIGARFRYKCEGRSAGCIRGVNSTDKQKTFPTIKVNGYQGVAGVVVSCVSKDGPPFYPHPHNLVGKSCTNGVCYKSINTPDMICSFSNLGIQCVKKKDVKESLCQREAIQVDPFGTGFTHHLEVNKLNLNALRLCFQVFLPDESGKPCVPVPAVISNPIFDNKTVSDLLICKLSHYSSPVTGGQEIILLCDQVHKDDIQILFYEEHNNKVVWCANGKFSPHHVHRKAAISFETPPYRSTNILQPVNCFIQLTRPSDGAVGKPLNFTYIPLRQDPEGMIRKRSKFEALGLHQLLQPSNFPTTHSVAVPRVFKQAVRMKTIPSGPTDHFQAETAYIQQSLIQESDGFMETVNMHQSNPPHCVLPSSSDKAFAHRFPISHQKVDDFLSAPKDQMDLSGAPSFLESDETLDKLSSLDLGIDPNDLDVNLSGITLDSFSESIK